MCGGKTVQLNKNISWTKMILQERTWCVCPHLVVPGFPTEHLGALEAWRQTLGSESSAFWEKLHVDALPEVDEDEAVVHVLWLETLVLQEPETQQCDDGVLWPCWPSRDRTAHLNFTVICTSCYLSPNRKLSGLMSPWMMRMWCSCSTMFRIQMVKYMTRGWGITLSLRVL